MNVTTGRLVTTVPWFVYAAPLTLAVLLFAILWWSRRRTPVEHPDRFDKFIKETQSLDWSDSSSLEAIKKTYIATVALFQAEVQYYYYTRSNRRRAAVLFKVAAFAFGSAGIICPLLAAAVPEWSDIGGIGYVLLAIATVCFAGDGLFGGTTGHIRSVVTQYELEGLLTKLSLSWNEWASRHSSGEAASIAEAFKILQEFTDNAYRTMAKETHAWAVALREAEQSYRGFMDSARPRRRGG